jgi:hypothetical protein
MYNHEKNSDGKHSTIGETRHRVGWSDDPSIPAECVISMYLWASMLFPMTVAATVAVTITTQW